jgi:transcriptional regulator NrdR family protein
MKCAKCNAEKTNVTQTAKHESGGVLRRRKCYDCGLNFLTLESVHEVPRKLVAPKKKAIYTKQDAALINKIKTEIRRKNEDVRKKTVVPNYFIEDDDY